MVLMGKGCVGGVTAGLCARDAAGDGLVLLWALDLEGVRVSLWEQRGKRDLPGLGWVSVKVR